MTVFGIDLSLTATGVASFDGTLWDTATIRSAPSDKSPGAFLDRVNDIAARIISWCDPIEGDTVTIEGPALHAKSGQLDRIFGSWWIVYQALREHHAEPFVIPPAVVKQLATGKGNAGKDEVLLATTRRLDAPVLNNNEADAAWLAVAATHIDGSGSFPLPQSHLTGLHKLLTTKGP
jgi:Holliday junction resolvasome RuvABC endonuclease subunit